MNTFQFTGLTKSWTTFDTEIEKNVWDHHHAVCHLSICNWAKVLAVLAALVFTVPGLDWAPIDHLETFAGCKAVTHAERKVWLYIVCGLISHQEHPLRISIQSVCFQFGGTFSINLGDIYFLHVLERNQFVLCIQPQCRQDELQLAMRSRMETTRIS